MKANKVWLTLLSLMLAIALAACSNGNGGNGPSTEDPGNEPPVTENTENDGGEEPDATASNEMDFDMGGRVIKVVSWWDMTIPEDNPDNIQRKENLEALKAKHNFDIEYIAVDYGEYQERVVASLMAGEPLGDIVRMGKAYMIPTLTKQGMFWPVDEYTSNENVFNQRITNLYSQYEGRGYGFSEGRSNLITGIFYNRTLMKNLGLKPLQEYVDEDNWNWETFIQVAKEANQDTNNDSKIDTWGLAGSSLTEQALAANETDLVNGDKHNLDDPKVVEALNFISKMATEGVARPTEGGDWTEPGQFFRQGNVLMYAGADYETSGLKQDMPDFDIGFVPFPKGPSASTYHAHEPAVQFLTIPKVVENPEQLMYIWEKINDIESIYDYPGQQGLETNFDNEDDIANARMAGDNMNIIDRNSFPSLPYFDMVAEIEQGISVSTVIEKYKAPIQAAIDEVYQ